MGRGGEPGLGVAKPGCRAGEAHLRRVADGVEGGEVLLDVLGAVLLDHHLVRVRVRARVRVWVRVRVRVRVRVTGVRVRVRGRVRVRVRLGPRLLEEAADGLRLLLVHGGLVGDADLLEVLLRVEVRGGRVLVPAQG